MAATSRWHVAVVVALMTAVVVAPSAQRDLVAALCAGLALVMIAAGLHRHRPERTWPWVVVAGGAACWALAAAVRAGAPGAAGELSLYLDVGARVLTVGGLLGLQWTRRPARPEAAVDAVIVAIVAALLLWVFLIAPGPGPGRGDGVGWWVTVVTATLDVLLAAQLTHAVTDPDRARPSGRLVTAAGAALLAGDVVQHVMGPLVPVGGAGAPRVLAVGALGLLGAAALRSPSSGRAEPGGRARRLDRRAALVVGVAVLLVPLLAVVAAADTFARHRLEVSVAGTAVAALLGVRLLRGAQRSGEQADHLERVAGTDVLTGLLNGPRFTERLDACTRSRAEHGGTVVLLVSLLRFSEINETLGMHTGDDLLRATAARLENAVGSRGVVARLSGATFSVLLHGDQSPSAARASAEAIRSAFHAPFLLLEVTVSLEVVVGYVCAHGPTGAADVLHRADLALTAARRRSDGVAHYAGEMEAGEALAAQLMGELHHAISASQVVVHFQPQVELLTGRVVGVEALARWHHPRYGMLGPASFVPGTERTGLIRPLTLHVLDRSLAAATRWRSAGREVRVAVNLSVRNLLDPELVDDVRRALQRHGLPPHLLELEITETMMMLDPTRSVEALRQLQALGVLLAIDDYGTGYSSLAYLQRLPVHSLKIDRSFVGAVGHDRASAVIVRSTIELAQRLGLTVVAEGVEDAATVVVLAEMGCAVGQGFGIGHPVPEAEVLAAVDRIESRAVQGVTWLPEQRGDRSVSPLPEPVRPA